MHRTPITPRSIPRAGRGARQVGPPPVLLTLALVALLAVACTAGPGTSGQAPSSTPGPATPASTASPARTYASRSFQQPFEVSVPDWLPIQADQDRPTFVTWDRPDQPAVRVMLPLALYPAGATKPADLPRDYLGYVLGLTGKGARFADRASITVGGRPATILTATTSKSLDGSLGCPEQHQSAADCFGLQPDLSLRLAVVPLDERVLLIWLRAPVDADKSTSAAKVAAFEQLLASLRFTGGSPSAAPSSARPGVSSALDGVWSATWTREELQDSPLLYDEGEVNDGNWGTYTLTLKGGKGTERITNAKYHGTDRFSYTVDGDVFTMLRGNEKFVMRWSISGDTLKLTRDETLGGGPTPYVIKPFVRQP